MKKQLLVVVMFVFMAVCSHSAFAGGERFAEGLCDIVSSPAQLGYSMVKHTQSTEMAPIGALAGVIEGSALMVNKGFHGLVKVLTFPFEY